MKRIAAVAIAALLLLAGPACAQSAFHSDGPTVSLAATTATARVAIQTAKSSSNVRIYNSGSAPVFVNCGDVTVVATLAAGMPIAAGTVEIINCATHLAGITSTGTATLYITPGTGI